MESKTTLFGTRITALMMINACDASRRRQQELEELHEELEYQLRPLLEKSGKFSLHIFAICFAQSHICQTMMEFLLAVSSVPGISNKLGE